MAEKLLVPVYIPRWLHGPVLRIKRALIPPAPVPETVVNICGERDVEWTFLSREMPQGPGDALEFGCEKGYLSLLAAQKGFHVIANDLQHQDFSWRHPEVEFWQGDFLTLPLRENTFDLAINCSSVEHVGIAGRYGIEVGEDDGDIEVMRRLASVLKPDGLLLMTAPCGRDAVMSPWCRVYGAQRLPRIFAPFDVLKEEYWIKNANNQWIFSTRAEALELNPRNHVADPHGCSYALGCFVLQKRVVQ